jgi:hypothetical protein
MVLRCVVSEGVGATSRGRKKKALSASRLIHLNFHQRFQPMGAKMRTFDDNGLLQLLLQAGATGDFTGMDNSKASTAKTLFFDFETQSSSQTERW